MHTLRRRGTLTALLAALLLTFGLATPASADEGRWFNLGGDARAQSASYSVVIGGNLYEVVRGSDNNIWFRYNNNTWRPLGGFETARTSSPPRIIEFPAGRALVVIRGMDSEIWYAQANSGSANFWTNWRQFATENSGAWAMGSPWLSLSVIAGTTGLRIDVPRYDGRINYRYIYDFNLPSSGDIAPTQGRGWYFAQGFQLAGTSRDIEGESQIALWGYGYPEWQSYFTGGNGHVYRARTDQRNGQVTQVNEVPGGAECDSGVGSGRLGNPNRVVRPGDGGYREQQTVMLSCVGNDGYVWINYSTDGGQNWAGWRHASDSPAPTTATPAVNSTFSEFTLTIRWNGARSTRYPNNAIVGKKIS
ncbi:hypothetical protein IAG44_42585 [Streptomyces roseirectus]|uniref:PLL-like beta propeller domain-containing protein n=1 Tax=Streptomyces roseirectus TaxID=2768066 RepID=A0A7H0IRM2_9ACTN|nr:hypothetical protein [Streptomyces roseirectus]QNP75438.1 hypothetical protein IAG44_42585 [Streptomyces roseirectus]